MDPNDYILKGHSMKENINGLNRRHFLQKAGAGTLMAGIPFSMLEDRSERIFRKNGSCTSFT
jgi:hypothetical protein